MSQNKIYMKTIEIIKDDLAMELGFESWQDYEDCSIIEGGDVKEVAKRYAQQYIDANKELYKEQLEEYASFQVLIKSMEDRIKELQQSNKELVEMLEFVGNKLNDIMGNTYDADLFSKLDIPYLEIQKLITKHKQ